MKKKEILKVCRKHSKKFEEVNKKNPYELRGIFSSEALLIISITKALQVDLLVESGRARGYSTKLFADFFNNSTFSIVSIDYDDKSKDAEYSEERLREKSNVSLIYGDSNDLIPRYTDKECVVFIDGPKGDEALLLAERTLRNKNVRAVFIHDLHKNTFHRNICNTIFSNTFFSDDEDFVNEFQYLDKDCWEKIKTYNYSPYVRKGMKIESYASTVAVIFNSEKAVNSRIFSNYEEYLQSKKPPSILHQVGSKVIPSQFKKIIKKYLIK